MKKIISVVGTRPNFMKIAPLHKAFEKYKSEIQHLICHTGQHYDENMSGAFFQDLCLPKPDFYLGAGSGTHAEQTAKIMVGFEKILSDEKPEMIIVPGDVNSTIACALTACKMGVKTAHVEAGLRSFDRTMPEEINRVLTDAISDLLFVTEPCGIANLINEGIQKEKCFLVGNCMIDNLIQNKKKIVDSNFTKSLDLADNSYCLLTVHRVANVENKTRLENIISLINEISENINVIFPIHPRTHKNIEAYQLMTRLNPAVKIIPPASYLNFMALLNSAKCLVTDSGGAQTEAMFLGTPCVTLRGVTEHLVTVESGANTLTGEDMVEAVQVIKEIIRKEKKAFNLPEIWDGKASERIVAEIFHYFH